VDQRSLRAVADDCIRLLQQASANSCQIHRADCSTHLVLPHNTTGGAIASSEGTQQGCRLPLSALHPLTREYHPWRPAAVLQYGGDTGVALATSRMFKGHSTYHKQSGIDHNQHRGPLLVTVHSIDWIIQIESSPTGYSNEHLYCSKPTVSPHNTIVKSHRYC